MRSCVYIRSIYNISNMYPIRMYIHLSKFFLGRLVLPSGKRLHSEFERSTMFRGKSQLFLWPCSTIMFIYQRVHLISLYIYIFIYTYSIDLYMYTYQCILAEVTCATLYCLHLHMQKDCAQYKKSHKVNETCAETPHI